jgi:PAS domain S-box-containing protein
MSSPITPSVPPLDRTHLEERLEASQRLMEELTQVHADLVTQGDYRALFERLLALMLRETLSEYGFIGEILHTPEGTPYLRTYAVTNIAWTDELRAQYKQNVARGIEFRNLKTLFGAVITTGEPVLTNDPASHASSGGIPHGHPPLRAFLGVPFKVHGEMVGMVGMANRPGGYDEGLIGFLRPLLTTCGIISYAWRGEVRRRESEQALLAQQAQMQKLAQKLMQSEERLRLALESAEEGLWDWDLRTGGLTVSPRWTDMLGYAEGMLEPTVELWRDHLCHPEDRAEIARRLQEHWEGRAPMFELEYRLRHRDGWWVWVLGRAKVVARDEQGRPVRMVGTNVDISSRKRAQDQLQAFIHAIPDMIFHLRLDGMCLAFKASTLEAPLRVPHEFVGSNLFALALPSQLLNSMRDGLRKLRSGSSLVVFEYSIETTVGLEHYEARLVSSGPDEAMVILRNVTERKRAEEQRRRQQEELEERVRQVTRELEARQAQLIQAEKLASLGQMAASIAHELNNPVSYVFSNVATLDEYIAVLLKLIGLYEQVEQGLGPTPSESVTALLEQVRALREQERVEPLVQDMKELLGDSKEGLGRIREFVHSLKTFVREESGTPQLADLTQVLQMSLRMVRHEFKYKCEVHTEFAPLPAVRCFPTQLNQVFMNLFINAAHAIEQRGEIRVTSRQEGSEAVVRITDTGKGMGPETLAKLFTPFFTTKPAGQGTGLGLSICYVIIGRHKGRIDVESEPGKGTTFTVRLPLSSEAPALSA